jgi:hypothetical protein
MRAYQKPIIVGVLGQWASGKSSAAAILLQYLGGTSKAIFLSDREDVTRQAVNYMLSVRDSQVTTSLEDDGRRRIESGPVTIWLNPGDDLRTVDLNQLQWDVEDELLPDWLNQGRLELGHRICENAASGKPIVIEAGFGKIPVDHTVYDLFSRLEQAGVQCGQPKWILIEAGFDTRAARNAKRPDKVLDEVFARFAADGGDLTPDQEKRLEAKGITITRVSNNHNDFEKFRADIISAFEKLSDFRHLTSDF